MPHLNKFQDPKLSGASVTNNWNVRKTVMLVLRMA